MVELVRFELTLSCTSSKWLCQLAYSSVEIFFVPNNFVVTILDTCSGHLDMCFVSIIDLIGISIGIWTQVIRLRTECTRPLYDGDTWHLWGELNPSFVAWKTTVLTVRRQRQWKWWWRIRVTLSVGFRKRFTVAPRSLRDYFAIGSRGRTRTGNHRINSAAHYHCATLESKFKKTSAVFSATRIKLTVL